MDNNITSEHTSKIFGHEKIEQILGKAIVTGHIFPTWIFCGPFGIGKSSIARKFAKCLLSNQQPQNGLLDIDANNNIHTLIDMRIHPDFFILEQTENTISIDETRNLLQKIRETPSMSKWRVVIIENASYLNKNIYNSLLKILEEPPKNTVIILICQNTGNIPKTLLSRAAKLNFNPIEQNTVKYILDNMNIPSSEKIAYLSDGSVGYAIHLHENYGIEIYNMLLQIFEFLFDKNMYQKLMYSLLNDYLTTNFKTIKTMIIKLLKLYVETLTDTIDYGKNAEESKILAKIINTKKISDISTEIKTIQEIIHMLNKCDTFMLDKSSLLIYVFEKLSYYRQ